MQKLSTGLSGPSMLELESERLDSSRSTAAEANFLETSRIGDEGRATDGEHSLLAELFATGREQESTDRNPWAEVDRQQRQAHAEHRRSRRGEGSSPAAALLQTDHANKDDAADPVELSASDGALVGALSSELVVKLTISLSDYVGNQLVAKIVDPLAEDLAAQLEPRLLRSLKRATENAVRRVLPVKLHPKICQETHGLLLEPLLDAMNYTLHNTLFPALAHSIGHALADTFHPNSPAHQDPSCWNACLGWRPSADDPRFSLLGADSPAGMSDYLRQWVRGSEQLQNEDRRFARPEGSSGDHPGGWRQPLPVEDPRAWAPKPWPAQSDRAGWLGSQQEQVLTQQRAWSSPSAFLETELHASTRQPPPVQPAPDIGERGFERPEFGHDRGWDEFCSRCMGVVTSEEAEGRARDARFRSWFGDFYSDYWRVRAGPKHPPEFPNPFARGGRRP